MVLVLFLVEELLRLVGNQENTAACAAVLGRVRNPVLSIRHSIPVRRSLRDL